MDLLNRLFQSIREAGRGLLFWALILLGGALIIFALRSGAARPAPLSQQPVNPARDETATPPPVPLASTSPAAEFPPVTPFPSPTPPPAGDTIADRPTQFAFPTITPPGFDVADLTRTPTPMTPPTRTPIVPHAWGALGLVGVSEPIGDVPQAIAASLPHLFVLTNDTLFVLDEVGSVSPTVSGMLPLEAKTEPQPSILAVQGTKIYIAHQDAGLLVVDAENPDDMQLVSRFWPQTLEDRPELLPHSVQNVVVHNDRAYVLSLYCPSTPGCPPEERATVLDVLAVSNPKQPEPITRRIIPGDHPALAAAHPFVFVGDDQGRIHIWQWENDELVAAGEPLTLTRPDSLASLDIDTLQPASGDRVHVVSNEVWWILQPQDGAWSVAQGPFTLFSPYQGGIFLGDRAVLIDGSNGGVRLMDVTNPASAQDIGAYGPAWGLPGSGYTQPFVVVGSLIYAIDGNGSINVLQMQ